MHSIKNRFVTRLEIVFAGMCVQAPLSLEMLQVGAVKELMQQTVESFEMKWQGMSELHLQTTITECV